MKWNNNLCYEVKKIKWFLLLLSSSSLSMPLKFKLLNQNKNDAITSSARFAFNFFFNLF